MTFTEIVISCLLPCATIEQLAYINHLAGVPPACFADPNSPLGVILGWEKVDPTTQVTMLCIAAEGYQEALGSVVTVH